MLRSLNVSGSQLSEVPEGTPHFRGVSPETYKQRSILDPKSDFPCARIEITTSFLGLKCKQKHDLLLGVTYPFKATSVIQRRKSAHFMYRLTSV